MDAGNVAGLVELLEQRLGPRDCATRQIRAVVEWLNDPAHHCPADSAVEDSEMTEAQLEQIRGADLLRATGDARPPTVVARLRKEEKRSSWRLRTIFHTLAANDGAKMFTKSMMRVNSIKKLKRMARRNAFGATRDFKSFFHQLLLSLAVSEKYVIRVAGKSYSLTRAAMGHKASAAAAHSITRAIAILAADGEAEWDVIIDDVAFFANTQEALDRVTRRFDEICASLGFTIGSGSDPSHLVSHRGIDFDLATKRVRVRETTRDRTLKRLELYARRPSTAKARSLLGTAVAAAQVIPIPVCDLMRRTAAYLRGGPPADFSALAAVISNDAPNDPTSDDELPYAGAIVADATPISYGGVYVDAHGNVDYIAGTFAPGQFISVNEAEAWATVLTAQLVPPRRHWAHIDVFTDNQVWCGALGRDWAKAPLIDIIRQRVTVDLTTKRLVARNTWVASANNPTDNISRQRNWTPDDTAKLNDLLKVRPTHAWSPRIAAPG